MHVWAIGRRYWEFSLKVIRSLWSNPNGGTSDAPVQNANRSSKETSRMPAENILKVFYIIYMCNVIYYTNFAGKYKCTLNFFYNINLPSQSEQKDSKQ